MQNQLCINMVKNTTTGNYKSKLECSRKVELQVKSINCQNCRFEGLKLLLQDQNNQSFQQNKKLNVFLNLVYGIINLSGRHE